MSNKLRIVLDTNILLDIALKRPGYQSSGEILRCIIDGKYSAFVAAHTLPTIFYYISRDEHVLKAKEFIRSLLNWIEVLSLDHASTCIALESEMKDFEDALIDVCALSQGMDIIITGNISDFVSAKIPAFTASEFLKKYK